MLILFIKVFSLGKEWFLIVMIKFFRIFDCILIVFVNDFREIIYFIVFFDERFFWKEEKSYISINVVNDELFKKDLF